MTINKERFLGQKSLSILSFLIVMMWGITVNAAPMPDSFADLADSVSSAVVNISSTQFPDKPEEEENGVPHRNSPFDFRFEFGPEGAPGPFRDFFDQFFNGPQGQIPLPGIPGGPLPDRNSLGSGFVIDAAKGYVVTNNHVIDQADEIDVILNDDTTLKAEVVGRDAKTDLAVLKVDPSQSDLTQVSWGDSTKMRVGDWVLAVGNPFGLGGTVTAGIISARQRDIQAGPYDDFIQTDASINRGNSGGPMFNMTGEVIGINTAIFSPTGGSVGIGFAVPSDLARPVIEQLIEFGHTKRGWLGVRIQHVTDDIADSLGLDSTRGALVAGITPDGPAQDGGIKTGDIILEFDGKKVDEMRELPRIVADTEIGKKVKVGLWRQGKKLDRSVKLGQLEKAEEEGLLDQPDILGQLNPGEDPGTEVAKIGLILSPVKDREREQYGLNADTEGLVVTSVKPQSDASKKMIQIGDVISEVNQTPVRDIDDIKDAIEKAEDNGKKSVLLLVETQGTVRFVALKLNE